MWVIHMLDENGMSNVADKNAVAVIWSGSSYYVRSMISGSSSTSSRRRVRTGEQVRSTISALRFFCEASTLGALRLRPLTMGLMSLGTGRPGRGSLTPIVRSTSSVRYLCQFRWNDPSP